MSNKISVEIVRETEKAVLVSFEGRQAWAQKRWVADNQMNEATFEKGAFTPETEEEKEAKREARNAMIEIIGLPTKETEKALLFEVQTFVEKTGQKCSKESVWLPKSQIKDNCLPAWLVGKKVDEIFNTAPTCVPISFSFLGTEY